LLKEKKEKTTHVRVRVGTKLQIRAERRPGEKSDDDVINRLLETQKKVDVLGLKVQ
jgi:predicted CopG family antitoxin